MVIVQVAIEVKKASIPEFISATIENAKNSIHEPGVIRFDFIMEKDNPLSFVLIEVYRDEDAARAHKKTTHYRKWRETVAEMMSVPRRGVHYSAIYPVDEKAWSGARIE
jgi:autoinducer 2-degrading protein